MHGYGLTCDLGGWMHSDELCDAVRQEMGKRAKGYDVDLNVLLNLVLSNPKSRFAACVSVVDNEAWRPSYDPQADTWTVDPMAFGGNPRLGLTHGRAMAFRATSGWGIPFVAPERTMTLLDFENVPNFASCFVHATTPERLASIAAHGIMTEADFLNDPTGRAFVHMVPVSPLQDWEHYIRIAKAPYEATAYVWVDRSVLQDQPVYMTPSHAVLTRSIHPEHISAMGLWMQGAGGGTCRIVYQKEVGDRDRLDHVPATPGAVTTTQLMGLSLTSSMPRPDASTRPSLCYECGASLGRFWLECPRCGSIFIFRGEATAVSARAAASICLPANAEENPRFARIVAFGPRRSGKRSKASEVIKQGSRTYKHVKEWEMSQSYRVQQAAQGKTIVMTRRCVDTWIPEDVRDPYCMSPYSPRLKEAEALVLIVAYIVRYASGAPDDKVRLAEYKQRCATAEMLIHSDMTAARAIELSQEAKPFLDEILDAVPLATRLEIEDRKDAAGRPLFSRSELESGVMNAAGLLALAEVAEIVAAHGGGSADTNPGSVSVLQGALISVATFGALFAIKCSIKGIALYVAYRKQVGPSGASPDVVDLLVSGVVEGAPEMVGEEEVAEAQNDVEFVATAPMPLASSLPEGYSFVWKPFAAGPILEFTGREDSCPTAEINLLATLIAIDLIYLLLRSGTAV